jgi:hypothetical protein
MPQLTLFPTDWRTPGLEPPHSGSETSRAAAQRIKPLTGALRKEVLRFIAERGDAGATDHEIAAGLGMLSDTARARRCELRDLGLVRDSGERRLSPSGGPEPLG